MHHGVHPVFGENTRYGGLPDIGTDEFRTAQMMLGRDRVHSDHPVHTGVALNAPYETASELPRRSGHEHDLAQDQRLP
jgi:hypothetical protein